MSHVFQFLASHRNACWVIENPDELRHLRQVCRLNSGAEVIVFDGKGLQARGILGAVTSRSAEVNNAVPLASVPLRPLHMIVGLPKPDTLREIIASLTELGVTHLWLLTQKHTPGHYYNASAQQRWQRWALEATKQCKRSMLPKIQAVTLAGLAAKLPDGPRIVLDPKGTPWNGSSAATCVAIGSEAGFSAEEAAALAVMGFKAKTIAPFVLRCYTAAIVGAGLACTQQFSAPALKDR